MVLLAPLAAEAGGYGWCKARDGEGCAVFRDGNDPDYQKILQASRAAQLRQQAFGRPGQPHFRPSDYYIRWMKRFGVLPDVYATDAAYWRSFCYRPPRAPGGESVAFAAGRLR